MPPPATATAVLAAAVIAAGGAAVAHRWSPPPAADSARGSEDAFATGLQRRELPPRQAPIRWTTGAVSLEFQNLPRETADLEVALAGHRGPVVIASDGVVLGTLAPGATTASFPLPATGRRTRSVRLEVPVFIAPDGRALGTRFQRVVVRPRGSGAPGLALLGMFLVPAMLAAVLARRTGMSLPATVAFAAAVTASQVALLWPSGLVRSPYALRLAALLAAGLVAAAVFALWMERRRPGAGRWALLAMSAAWLVQGVLATSPAMIVSDAVFHANNLSRVAGGDLFPTSVTQHSPPFRFPYGVSFYALLAPLLRAGLDGVALVRWGAALAGVAASAALFVVLLRGYGSAAAGLSVVILQTLPATFDVAFSYGNFSNAFGQSVTLGFLAWWAGSAPLGWPAGAILLALAATAHFSSLIVAGAGVTALVVARRDVIRGDRARALAVVIGLAVAAAYYAHHAGLVATQLPRLFEGSGPRAAASPGVFAAARAQVLGALAAWGAGAIALAFFGRPSPRQGPAIDRDLAAWWIGAGVLALPALISPLEVRYLHALTPVVAVAAARGALFLHDRGGALRPVAWALVGVQVAIGVLNLAEAVYSRYRG